MLNDVDKAKIVYYVKEYGDLKKWRNWEEKKDDVEKELPHLLHAIEQVNIYAKILRCVINDIELDIDS